MGKKEGKEEVKEFMVQRFFFDDKTDTLYMLEKEGTVNIFFILEQDDFLSRITNLDVLVGRSLSEEEEEEGQKKDLGNILPSAEEFKLTINDIQKFGFDQSDYGIERTILIRKNKKSKLLQPPVQFTKIMKKPPTTPSPSPKEEKDVSSLLLKSPPKLVRQTGDNRLEVNGDSGGEGEEKKMMVEEEEEMKKEENTIIVD